MRILFDGRLVLPQNIARFCGGLRDVNALASGEIHGLDDYGKCQGCYCVFQIILCFTGNGFPGVEIFGFLQVPVFIPW